MCVTVCTCSFHTGKLVLKIPWKNLYSEPVVAQVDGLYLLVRPSAGENCFHWRNAVDTFVWYFSGIVTGCYNHCCYQKNNHVHVDVHNQDHCHHLCHNHCLCQCLYFCLCLWLVIILTCHHCHCHCHWLCLCFFLCLCLFLIIIIATAIAVAIVLVFVFVFVFIFVIIIITTFIIIVINLIFMISTTVITITYHDNFPQVIFSHLAQHLQCFWVSLNLLVDSVVHQPFWFVAILKDKSNF